MTDRESSPRAKRLVPARRANNSSEVDAAVAVESSTVTHRPVAPRKSRRHLPLVTETEANTQEINLPVEATVRAVETPVVRARRHGPGSISSFRFTFCSSLPQSSLASGTSARRRFTTTRASTPTTRGSIQRAEIIVTTRSMHGPFLFHANALVYLLFGDSDASSRYMPAFFGSS